MTEALQWRSRRITDADLNRALQWGDTNHNGSLLDASDRCPRVEMGEQDGLLLLSPELAARYRTHFATGPSAVPAIFRATPSSDTSLAERSVLLQDPTKKTVTTGDLIEIMRRNGGHPVRLGDLAWAFPRARLRGEGERLEDLRTRWIYSDTHPDGVRLADAFLDPGGELIVSHFYATELRGAAPRFTQFMTNVRGTHADPRCHDPSRAFGIQACNPDSWPVGLDTLLANASLEVPLRGSDLFPVSSRAEREDLLRSLDAEAGSLPGVTRSSRGLTIDLRATSAFPQGPAGRILERLNELFPGLHCDPSRAEDMSFYTGAPSAGGTPSAAAHRRVLLALLDDPSLSLTYRDADANNPALFNGAAERPALHFLARIDPADPERVVFGILHIDAQSYKPRGTTGHDAILAPGEGPSAHANPQHQGEVEPLYLLYRRSERSPHMTLEGAFLGDHLVAEPVRPGEYTGELAVAYGSGGRILRRDETTWQPGMQYRTGTQSGPSTYFSTALGVFPYVEVYPGRSDTTGDHPTARRFTPDDYTLLIEGEGGDFLTTGRLLARNGVEGDSAYNQSGFPFVRGSRTAGDSSERSRVDVGLGVFLRRQEAYEDNRLMGRTARFSLVGGLFPPYWAGTDPSPVFGDGAYRIGIRYEPVNAAWVGPHYLEGYLYNPFSASVREAPQMGLDVYSRPESAPRVNLWADILGFGAGLHSVETGFYAGFNVFVGPQIFAGLQEAGPFGGGAQASLRAFTGWQRGSFDLRLVTEGRCEAGGGSFDGNAFGHAGCAWFPLALEVGGRSRGHY